jgi:hypothetical protein
VLYVLLYHVLIPLIMIIIRVINIIRRAYVTFQSPRSISAPIASASRSLPTSCRSSSDEGPDTSASITVLRQIDWELPYVWFFFPRNDDVVLVSGVFPPSATISALRRRVNQQILLEVSDMRPVVSFLTDLFNISC